jgi:hypothetical protein
MTDRDYLLRPSLSGEAAPETTIYSATTGYMAAFFGGPVGGAVVGLVNAWRLRRLGRDWPLALAAIAMAVGLSWWNVRGGGGAWLTEQFGRSGTEIALRVVGLVFFAGVYLIHRRYYRSMEMMGNEPPSGWVLGFAGAVVGLVATFSIMAALK